jgi:hypothetical protein
VGIRYGRVQWQGRIGQIRSISRNNATGNQSTARVMWQGRKTLSEGLPIKFLEVAAEL